MATLPAAILTAILLAILGSTLGLPAPALPLGWLVICSAFRLGQDLLWQRLLARRLPPPLPAELSHAWEAVCRRAGVDGSRYRLGVFDNKQENGYCWGRTIVVSTGAVQRARPNLLEAILAHEFGHSLLGKYPSHRLTTWYCAPVAGVVRAMCWLVALIIVVYLPSAVSSVWWFGRFCCCVLAVLALTPLLGPGPAVPFGILSVLEVDAMRYLARKQEHHADRVALDLGYGAVLLGALRRWSQRSHKDILNDRIVQLRTLIWLHEKRETG